MNFLNRLPYKIFMAPMAGGIVNPEIVAQVTNSGLFGQIPAGYLSIKSLDDFINKTKTLTGKPFGVNIFIEEHRTHELTLQKPERIIQLEKLLQLDLPHTFTVPPTVPEREYIDLIIKHGVAVASCTFGFFNKQSVDTLKKHGIGVIGTATSTEEFLYCVESGAEAVVIQGCEAGGHQGSFLSHVKNETTLKNLLFEVKRLNKNVKIIAAGGVSSANMHEYFRLGTDYVQLGTGFMMTYQSGLPDSAKKFMQNNKHSTILTNAITGKWARGVANTIAHGNGGENEVLGFPLQHYATAGLRAKAKNDGNCQCMSLWAGQEPENLEIRDLSAFIIQLQTAFNNIT